MHNSSAMKACPACNSRYDDQTTFCVKDGSPVVPDAMQPQGHIIGQLIGDRYRILKKIGEGGMGEVYVAEHIHIEKKVALKLLRPEVLSNAEAVARFRQEARSASKIGHDNIIQIDDFGTLPDGRVYMAMEYLQGEALNDLIGREPLPMPRALDIMIQVAKGLAAAHAQGITHRDMKPENVFVTFKEGRDVPKILDFGIAKVSGGDTAQNLTVAGTIFGTPFYMAPEQAMGGKMDHRVDIYAMGIILYEVFCGVVPFKAETFMGILTQHITMQPVPPSEQASKNGRLCSRELEGIILKAIQKDASQRYQTMGELVNALIEFYRFAVGPTGTTVQPWGGPNYGTGSASRPWPAAPGYHTGRASQPIELTQRKKSGSMIWAVVGAVVVLGGGGAAFFLLQPKPGIVVSGNKDAGTSGQIASGAAPDAGHKETTLVLGSPDAGTAGTVAQNAGPPDAGSHGQNLDPRPDLPLRPSVVDVVFDSTPPGAIVRVNGKSYGEAPAKVGITRGKSVKVEMTMRGYQPEVFTVDGSAASVHRTLKLRKIDVDPTLKPPEDDGLAKPSY